MLGSGVPPVGLGGDVVIVEDAVAIAVVDGEFVVFEIIVFYQSANDKAVVHTVAVGGDHVGERKRGVSGVSVPEDVEIVVDAAVATCLVVGVVDVVVDDVGEAGVECTAVCRRGTADVCGRRCGRMEKSME